MSWLRVGLSGVLVLAITGLASGQTKTALEPLPNPAPKPLTVEVKPIQVCKGHSYDCHSVDISPDGQLLATTGNLRVRLWNLATGKQVGAFDVVAGDSTFLAVFSPDGKALACTCGDGCAVHLLTTASGKVIKRIGPLPARASLVAFAPDGKRLLTVCDDCRLRVWDVTTGEEIKKSRLGNLGKKTTLVALSPDCRRIVLQAEENTCVLDVESGKEVCRFPWGEDEKGPERSNAFVFSPDGRYLTARVRAECAIRLWDLTTGKLARDITWDKDPDEKARQGAYTLTFSPDAKSLIVACNDGRIRVWETATGGLRYQAEEATGFILAARDSSLLVTADHLKATLRVWDRWNPAGKQGAEIKGRQADQLWDDLRRPDSAQAFQAMTSLVIAPDDTIALIGRRLKAVEPADGAKLDRLIANLDSNDFPTRDAASRQLAQLGPTAKAKLLAAQEQGVSKEASRRIESLLDGLENPEGAEWRRTLRTVEVLEAIRTPAARRLLEDLAQGAPGALLTEQAKASLKRLKKD
jgi:hypothetical protein